MQVTTKDKFVKRIQLCQTSVHYMTRRLSEVEFPVLISISADPGYNRSLLTSFGFSGEWGLFKGKHREGNSSIHLEWKYGNNSIKGLNMIFDRRQNRLFI